MAFNIGQTVTWIDTSDRLPRAVLVTILELCGEQARVKVITNDGLGTERWVWIEHLRERKES